MAESLRSRGLTPIPATRSFEVLQAFLQTQVTNAVVANVHWNELVRLFAGKTPSLFADLSQTEAACEQAAASVRALASARRLVRGTTCDKAQRTCVRKVSCASGEGHSQDCRVIIEYAQWGGGVHEGLGRYVALSPGGPRIAAGPAYC